MAGRKILLVEGTDDEHVLKHICANRSIPFDEVKPLGDARELLRSIPVQIRASSEEGDAVGLVIDANRSLGRRWQAIRDRLIEVGYRSVPREPDPDGIILESPSETLLPRVGVWIMPDNRTLGILENFLRSLVSQQDVLLQHAIVSVKRLPEKRFSPKDEPKAIMHTWLAWQKEPGKAYGTAIKAGFLDAHAPVVDALVSWLGRLFQPVPCGT